MFQGISGCGKGTQAAKLKEFLDSNTPLTAFIMEAGHGFRTLMEKKDESYMAELSSRITASGGWNPTFLSVWNWTNILINEMGKEHHIIFDGSPRQPTECPIVDDLWDFVGHEDPVYMLYIKLSDDEARKRLSGRGRHDDHLEEYVENRLTNFKRTSPEILEYYRNHPRYEFVEIDGDKSIEEIHNQILEVMELK